MHGLCSIARYDADIFKVLIEPTRQFGAIKSNLCIGLQVLRTH